MSLAALVLAALVFNFLNGLHDSANIVATVISSRALPARLALILTAIAEFCGPFLLGVAVATTIGQGVVVPGALTTAALLAALLSGIGWNVLTWLTAIPSSSSHALVGGLIGAVAVQAGPAEVNPRGLALVLAALFLSPALGLAIGYLLTRLIFWLASAASPRINVFFQRAQILTAMALALSHGANDAQKTMGVVALGLMTTGVTARFQIPLWVVAACGAALALGTAVGGWRLIKTLGARFYRIRPVHGFSAQLTSTGVVLAAALLGGPVSTTQVVSSAILGAGSAERLSKVRWGVAGHIAIAWLLTIPCTAALSAGLTLVLARFA
jgi:PiT family inorganic phosphate transporter